MPASQPANRLERLPVRRREFGLALMVMALASAPVGCGKTDSDSGTSAAAIQSEPAAESPAAAPDQAAPEPEATTTDSIHSRDVAQSLSEAQQRLQAGEFDIAAAELLRVQVEGRQFDAHQAADYREALGQATAAALAAAERGDPRGQAALQMLRAARRR
jgi:hypothetical protein